MWFMFWSRKKGKKVAAKLKSVNKARKANAQTRDDAQLEIEAATEMLIRARRREYLADDRQALLDEIDERMVRLATIDSAYSDVL